MACEERVVHAVLLPGEVLENGNKVADITVELVALIGEKGPPAYQVVRTSLAPGENRFPWTSCLYDHPLLASTEYFRHTEIFVNPEDYEAVVSGRVEKYREDR